MLKPTVPLLSLVLLFTSSVRADGCAGPVCGTIANASAWTLLYTTNPTENNHCTSCCYFWNWRNGPNGAQQTSCSQASLGTNQSKGGSGVDVDGFTYADRD
ncbi:hypothetical protein M407DRAFT_27045 [Tulasnella calospora MUT 4182]|uniref:Uncharacterized protein n=1 Tax=Tulasnella calospora MUT 4182 TaxID=1051891 RepID=A0A0C3QEN2_9AGAM|nr:hypothetical protein M407DRAFT_27045 [Tulasnella calospora MUT 4182]